MIEINNIPVYDGKPTEAGEKLMELVHEAAGMGCYHKLKLVTDSKGASKGYMRCCKCYGNDYERKIRTNPAYLTSLDAYCPVWGKLEDKSNQKLKYAAYLNHANETTWPWEAQPYHHLEALARTLTVECKKCNNNEVLTKDCPACQPNGDCVITVLQAWKEAQV